MLTSVYVGEVTLSGRTPSPEQRLLIKVVFPEPISPQNNIIDPLNKCSAIFRATYFVVLSELSSSVKLRIRQR